MPTFVRVANLFRSSTENHHHSAHKTSILSRTSNSFDRMSSSTAESDPGGEDRERNSEERQQHDGASEQHDGEDDVQQDGEDEQHHEDSEDGEDGENGEEDDEDDDGQDEPRTGAAANTTTNTRRNRSIRTRLSNLASMRSRDAKRKKRRRLPFSLAWPGKDTARRQPALLDCVIESQPVMFHGTPDRSTGALVSGQLVLEVQDERLEVANLEASIVVRVVQKRPYQGHCGDCALQEEELKQWSFLRHPVTLLKGTHKFPFSNLLEGNNPISTETPVISIAYYLKAEAIVARHPSVAGSSVTPIRLELPLPVRRSLPQADSPHHSIRVFPPTEIRANAHYSQVLYPNGKTTMTMTLDGLSNKVEGEDVIQCWKLKKASWRLEETIRAVAKACPRHCSTSIRLTDDEPRNQIMRTETRILGEQVVAKSWKEEYSASGGNVDLEFDFSLQSRLGPQHSSSSPIRHACDVSTATSPLPGCEVTVSHALMVEFVVSKARADTAQPDVVTETGTGRILRMRFKVYLSEAGTGVSWEDEAPPLYGDVPPSPPGYDGSEDEAEDVISVGGSEEGDGLDEAIHAARNSTDVS